MAPTESRPGGKPLPLRIPLLVLAAGLLAAACSAVAVATPTPGPPSTATARMVATRANSSPVASPTQAPSGPVIEQVVLASSIDDQGGPADPRTVFPQDARRLVLCVRASDLLPGIQFRAVWYEGDEQLGQSDYVVGQAAEDSEWVALVYLPRFGLNPSKRHVVELLVDLKPVDRFVFRVGVGAAADIVAESALGVDVDQNGKIVGENTHFKVGTTRMALMVRISTQVDPNPMTFDTIWYRNDTRIAQIHPRDGQPRFEGTPTHDNLRMFFIFDAVAGLLPGNYRVTLTLNGVEIDSYPFTVTDTAIPTATTGPTPTPTSTPPPTPTPEPTHAPSPTSTRADVTPTSGRSAADVTDLVVTSEVDPATDAPVGPPVFVWEADPESLVTLWVAIRVEGLTEADVLSITVYQDGEVYGSRDLPRSSVLDGWVATTIGLDSPSTETGDYVYTVATSINGQRALETSFQVSAIQGP